MTPSVPTGWLGCPGHMAGTGEKGRGKGCHDIHVGVNARNLIASPMSSSQLMSRRVATARLGRVVHLVALGLLLVEVREVGNGRRVLLNVVGR